MFSQSRVKWLKPSWMKLVRRSFPISRLIGKRSTHITHYVLILYEFLINSSNVNVVYTMNCFSERFESVEGYQK